MSTQILYSSVRPSLKQSKLHLGLILGLLGVGLFLYMGISLAPGELQFWGIPGFFVSGVLVTLGLKPYRRLMTLEGCPHHLRLGPGHRIEFAYASRPFLALAAKDIAELSYRDAADSYGIVVRVRDLKAVQKLSIELDLEAYVAVTQRRYGGDLFFPFFSQRSFDLLVNHFKAQTVKYRASL